MGCSLSKWNCLSQVNALLRTRKVTCFALVTILTLGSACNSWPAFYRVENPGRRVESPPVSQSPQVNSEPVSQSTMPAPESENQQSDNLSQQAASSAWSLPTAADSSATVGPSIAQHPDEMQTITATQSNRRSDSKEPIDATQLVRSQVQIQPMAPKSERTTHLVIAGVRPERGKVKVAIYTDANTFPNPAGASKTFHITKYRTICCRRFSRHKLGRRAKSQSPGYPHGTVCILEQRHGETRPTFIR
jgi:cytoskeletal protein RodZ